MVELTSCEFKDFYREIHGYEPYPWQSKLAEQVIETGRWPESINVPTGCGKTSCIDIAVYALACNPEKNPRRIVFVVNRRIVVDEGNERAKKISDELEKSTDDSILGRVKKSLCDISGGKTALMHAVLRGGTHIDNEWSSNPVQPIVIASTVDQAGSRLLFRGYGLGRMSRLVNAGLLGYDCLWILDETHISKPFTETLRRIEEFRKEPWIEGKSIPRPWGVVEMTATPIKETERFELSDADYKHDKIKRIVEASKMCKLIESNAKDSKDYEKLASDIQKQALELEKDNIKAIAIVVNRIATAKEVYRKLKESGHHNTHLMIGRMRPWDRDKLWRDIKPFKTGEKKPTEVTFIVTTQCLEVGADLDFAGMVSEASSLDSLRQRFGRLNRSGEYLNSRCSIVAPKSVVNSNGSDFIYGDTVSKTWDFLKNNATNDTIDFGIKKFKKIIDKCNYDQVAEFVMPGPVSCNLLPSHMDLLCQTHNHLHIDPDISPFLHGFERGSPMVSVIWRSGLDANWEDIMNALLPKSIESMQVPIWDIRKYLKNEKDLCADGDVEWQLAEGMDNEKRAKGMDNEKRAKISAWVWRGKKSGQNGEINPDDIKPSDVIVLRTEDGGWSKLGHIPDMDEYGSNENTDKTCVDIAEKATFESTKKLVIRMGNNFPVKMTDEGKDLIHAIKNEYSKMDIEKIKKTIWKSLEKTPLWDSLKAIDKTLKIDSDMTNSPIDHIGELDDNILLIKSRYKTGQKKDKDTPKEILEDHTDDVVKNVKKYVEKLKLDDFTALFEMTAKVHDIGKADKRFQDMLYRSKMHHPQLRAKDNGKKKDSSVIYYPKGFRHEFISSEFAKTLNTFDNDLFLHLVESHHGHCRPFVPVVIDDENPNIEYVLDGKTLQAQASTGIERVGSGAAKRFWICVRKYGWWGLAWLEALFILADWEASGGTN